MTWVPEVREVVWFGQNKYEASITDGDRRLYVTWYSDSLYPTAAAIDGDTFHWRWRAAWRARRAARRMNSRHDIKNGWVKV